MEERGWVACGVVVFTNKREHQERDFDESKEGREGEMEGEKAPSGSGWLRRRC